MKYSHNGLEFDVEVEWLEKSGVRNFVPESSSYIPDESKVEGKEIFYVLLNDIEPLKERASSKGVFCADDKSSAEERVLRLLRWFVAGESVEPVRVVCNEEGDKYKYRLTEGCHRLHCSIVVGFTGIPAVEGFDINALDRK